MKILYWYSTIFITFATVVALVVGNGQNLLAIVLFAPVPIYLWMNIPK